MAEESKQVLFEITVDQLETGMRGYPIGYCTTSTVDPIRGLHYVGKPVVELCGSEPENVIYLLYYGRQGSKEEIKKFTDDLNGRAKCSPEVIKYIQQLPKKGNPMKLFSAALLICGMMEGVEDYQQDCLNLIAKIPEIAASVINFHAGWGDRKESRPELGYMENFAHMLNAPNVDKESLTKVFKLFNILHYDHGGGNLSTFVGKAVASGLEDMYGSITAAMCALDGSRHGRANHDSLELVEAILKELGPEATPSQLEELLRRRIANNQLIFGFGHAVLRVEDPRATVLYAEAKKTVPNDPLVRISGLLREVAPKILGENSKISNPYANVDAISGVLLSVTGFNYPQYFTVLFGLARAVGIAIQIVYERCEARGGKGTPIIRPKYLFKPREKVSL